MCHLWTGLTTNIQRQIHLLVHSVAQNKPRAGVHWVWECCMMEMEGGWAACLQPSQLWRSEACCMGCWKFSQRLQRLVMVQNSFSSYGRTTEALTSSSQSSFSYHIRHELLILKWLSFDVNKKVLVIRKTVEMQDTILERPKLFLFLSCFLVIGKTWNIWLLSHNGRAL